MENLSTRDNQTMGVFCHRDPLIREKLPQPVDGIRHALSLPANPPDAARRAGNQFFLPNARGLMAFSAVILYPVMKSREPAQENLYLLAGNRLVNSGASDKMAQGLYYASCKTQHRSRRYSYTLQ